MDIEEYISTAIDYALGTLLWSETDDDGSPFDDTFSADEIEGDTDTFAEQLDAFVRDNWTDLEGTNPESCGHDFVLTRNGHGAGFWDGGWGDKGDRLTASCKPYGDASLYIGDDGALYLYA